MLAADPGGHPDLLRAAAQLRAAAAAALPSSEAEKVVLENVKQLRGERPGAPRLGTVLTIGASFRAVGGMALAGAIAAAVEGLTGHAADPGVEVLWVAHSLGLVAHACGAAFSRHASFAVDGALMLLSSEAAQQPGLGAASARVVNASCAALGPALGDGGGALLRRAGLLVQHATALEPGEPGAALEEVLFTQSVSLFAPAALDAPRAVATLAAALASRSQPLRAAAAALCRAMADARHEALRAAGCERSLYLLIDASPPGCAEVADATAALEAVACAHAAREPVAALRQAARTAMGEGDEPAPAPEEAPEEARDGDTPAPARPADERAAWLPGLHARAAAARLLVALVDAVPDEERHCSLAAARKDAAGTGMALHLQEAVELGYKVATRRAAAGLRMGTPATSFVVVVCCCAEPCFPCSSLFPFPPAPQPRGRPAPQRPGPAARAAVPLRRRVRPGRRRRVAADGAVRRPAALLPPPLPRRRRRPGLRRRRLRPGRRLAALRPARRGRGG